MHFNNVFTYARPFARLENQDEKTTFLLRVLKVRLEEYLDFELDDDMFCDIMEAAYCSEGSGPLPHGPIFGPQQSFIRLFRNKGYEEYYAKCMGFLRGFFFDSAGIVVGSSPDKIYPKKNPILEHYPSIVLHIPHSGTEFFGDDVKYQDTFLHNAKDLIDWYTDKLFAPDTENSKIVPVVFPFCRTACDVERMIDDPMEEKNLGICYDSHFLMPTNGFFKIEGGKSIERYRMEDISLQHYLAHHHKMENILLQNKGALLIDCHSFSSYRTVLTPTGLTDSQIADIDICIGYNKDKSKPKNFVIQTIKNHFASFGYRVAINTPFSNSKTFNSMMKYQSVMIEVNKRLYMDETTLKPNENFDKLHQQIIALYDKLLQ